MSELVAKLGVQWTAAVRITLIRLKQIRNETKALFEPAIMRKIQLQDSARKFLIGTRCVIGSAG